jgi:hypothetical protein
MQACSRLQPCGAFNTMGLPINVSPNVSVEKDVVCGE